MSSSIRGAKMLINRQLRSGKIYDVTYPFIKNSKMYFNTNENIDACFNYLDFDKIKKALVVLSSGDYIFNLLLNDVYVIDTFDTNQLTEYFVFGLKWAMIKKYNYQEFLKASRMIANENLSLEAITKFIIDLLPYMDQKYQDFWLTVADYNEKKQKDRKKHFNLMYLLSYDSFKPNKESNTYLKSEEYYNKVKANLDKAKITFKCENALNLDVAFQNKYDLILLSNITDFLDRYWGDDWGYVCLKEYSDKLHTITSEDGIILLAYSLAPDSEKIIRKSRVNLDEFDEEIHKVPSVYSPNQKDFVVLSRKKVPKIKGVIYGK